MLFKCFPLALLRSIVGRQAIASALSSFKCGDRVSVTQRTWRDAKTSPIQSVIKPKINQKPRSRRTIQNNFGEKVCPFAFRFDCFSRALFGSRSAFRCASLAKWRTPKSYYLSRPESEREFSPFCPGLNNWNRSKARMGKITREIDFFLARLARTRPFSMQSAARSCDFNFSMGKEGERDKWTDRAPLVDYCFLLITFY